MPKMKVFTAIADKSNVTKNMKFASNGIKSHCEEMTKCWKPVSSPPTIVLKALSILDVKT